MEETEKLLQSKCSFQESAWAKISKELNIDEILSDIKKQKYHSSVSALRGYLDNGEKEKYDSNKKRLPGVTFCGTFHGVRKRECLETYNELIVIDIDKLEPENLDQVKQTLNSDKYVFTFWESPSKNGVKGLIKIKYKFDYQEYGVDIAHKYAFKELVDYFASNYSIELDNSGSDTTRLCFFSSDENLVLKETFESFEIEAIVNDDPFIKKKSEDKKAKNKVIRQVTQKSALYNPEGKNAPQDRAAIQSIIKYLTKRKLSITGSYDNWFRVALAIANTFTHDIGEKYFLKLCRLDGGKHDEVESKNILLYCYENTRGDISFNTIYHYANKLGYVRLKRGSTGERKL